MKRRCVAEAFGTFCLVFAGTGSAMVNQIARGQIGVVGIGLVFGLIVLAMIYSVGHISGAHLNPAVTLGFAVSNRHPWSAVFPYIVSQLVGAVGASVLLRGLFFDQPGMLGMTLPADSWAQSLCLEFVLTLILMVVILGVATGGREEGLMAGVAIGGTVALEAIFGGPISGASMNPARSFAPALVMGRFQSHWIYWVGPILGSIAGAQIYGWIAGSQPAGGHRE